ncbi:MAG TPA: alpha/beta hydrolase, partial [Chitinophagaceae bacterium]|nr:alpha/beta hydrolase [Chitinophagaceae bacterium]
TNSKNRSMPEKSKLKPGDISGYVPVNGLKMYYEIHGDGTPLVLIHGGGSTIQTTFGQILPMLSQHYRVIAVELQAHGHTSDRNTAESFQQDADDVVGLLQYLKINKAHLFGFSNGGHTAMQIAISHPSFVDKLVLVSAFYTRDGAVPGFFDGLQSATLDNMPAPLKTAYLQINNDQKGLQAMFDKDRGRMLRFKDWPDEELHSIQARTFIIAGDHDVVTPQHAAKMAQVIPNARLMILPGTHGSFIGEACTAIKGSKIPKATVVLIEEFLDEKL